MTTTARQLTVNITTTNTWTQLTEGHGGSAYNVPAGGRADIKELRAINIGANSTKVIFAISSDSTISDDERVWQEPAILTGEMIRDDDVHVMRAAEGLWARATGTSPNVTFRADILEVTP